MAGDERSVVRRDEDDRARKLLREAEATHRNTRHQSRLVLRRAGKTGQHAGIRRTGRHAVHADSRLGGLERHRLGDAFDGVLAADIHGGPRRTLVPVGRGDVDDATVALSLHDAHFVLHAQDHAEDVRVERRGIAFRGLVRDRANLAFGAGIVHRDRAARPARKTFAIGFQTGHEMNWLQQAMHVLRDELKNIEVTVSSDYSPDLAEALARGRLDLAFMRVEPGCDLGYHVVDREPLIVLMPSDHRLTAKQAIHPRELVGEIFIGGANKAAVLRAVTEDYLRRSGVDIKLDHGVDNMAMAMSLVASTRGLALMPAYAKNLLPSSVVSRPLEGEAPTIDVAVGYSKSNTSPILKLFLSRLDELVGPNQKH